jgi:cell pole-organizing protein PopZ
MKFDNGIEITNLRNVQRTHDGAFILDVDLVTKDDPFETVKYCARDGDVAETGQWVYQQIIEGNFEGEITDWVPPPPPSVEEVAAQVRAVRDQKLKSEVDPVVSNPLRWNDMTEAQQQAWTDYRRALLDMPNDPAFPWYDTVVTTNPAWGSSVEVSKAPWPTKPL